MPAGSRAPSWTGSRHDRADRIVTATYGGRATPADLDRLPPVEEPTEAEVSALTRRYVEAVAAEHGIDLSEPPYHRAPKASLPSLLDDRDREAEANFWYPEDRGDAVLSPLGDVEYVEDFIRPGRIVVVAAEEGAGKSYAIDSELGIRVAVAGGSFAGTWPVLRTGPVLVMSEMHSDDDYHREDDILGALELDRAAIRGRYYRLPLLTAAGGPPALTVPEWRTWIVTWLRDHGALLARRGHGHRARPRSTRGGRPSSACMRISARCSRRTPSWQSCWCST